MNTSSSPSQLPNHRNLLPSGTILRGNYRIDRSLSSGGFGNTYLAFNLAFKEVCAVKEFFIKGVCEREADTTTVSVSNVDNEELFTQQLSKFKKEARRLRSIQNEHVVKVHDLFDENGTAHYVMDFVDGDSLDTIIINRKTPLLKKEILGYMFQILDALSSLHRTNILHLNIQPSTIMVNSYGHVVLIGFGTSNQIKFSNNGSSTAVVSYKKGYTPPEQLYFRFEQFGPWSDFYALGATLFKLLTNRNPPFLLLNKQELFPMPNVSKRWINLVLWMMSMNHRERPQSVLEIHNYLCGDYWKEAYILQLFSCHIPKYKYTTFVHPLPLNSVIQNLIENMVYVKGGSFRMGDTYGVDIYGEDYFLYDLLSVDERPVHDVNLSDFWIGKYPVTQCQWEAVMGYNPSIKKGDNHPVENINWYDCVKFIYRLNQFTGKHFRLPTEAEWEYAARGGNRSQGCKYSGSNNLDEVAWYDGNSEEQTHDVGTKCPNELGLYDMSGNVSEWCGDWDNHFSRASQKNPTGPSSGYHRICRGGSWYKNAAYCRVSARETCFPKLRLPYCGLRLVMQ